MASKAIVQVKAIHDLNGYITPIEIIWHDGRQYKIDKVIYIEKKASLADGGRGICYTCRILGKEVPLYHEDYDGKWFLEGR